MFSSISISLQNLNGYSTVEYNEADTVLENTDKQHAILIVLSIVFDVNTAFTLFISLTEYVGRP